MNGAIREKWDLPQNIPLGHLDDCFFLCYTNPNMFMRGGVFMGVQEPQKPSKRICVGLLAHVDAGKTTLSEALLYCAGARRTLGRVDHRDAFLDTDALERARGITIFSKQARLQTQTLDVTLVDTPGHVDFSAEAERVLPILDCAVLLISALDGVQAHTLTLWRLLERYQIPTFLFVNKMDLPGAERTRLLEQLQSQLSGGCLDFGQPRERLAEQIALCDEALLEEYLHTGEMTQGNIRGMIAARRVFPVCFGAALRLTGVEALLQCLDGFAPSAPEAEAFGCRVYKISRDAQNARLTWLRVFGGCLSVRQSLRYSGRDGAVREEKIQAVRLYSGDKFTLSEWAEAGTLCAVTGLSATYAGQGLGAMPDAKDLDSTPVMTCRVAFSGDPATLMPKLRMLEEEEPLLHVLWDEHGRQIQVQLMGRVQREVFTELVRRRFGLKVALDAPRVLYRETIAAPVEGIGHFEPLRHYAEVHLLLEPLPRGAGLEFGSRCPTDVLDANYQNLVLTHLAEKTHRGVLVGAPIADLRITLLIGRAHLKHTEGGDFRQATYRAVRQGLMQAESVLLEPWYRFSLTLPTPQVGRAITDFRAMGGTFDPPEAHGALSTLSGTVPASELGDYGEQLAAYTQGRGQLQLAFGGYLPCHNADQVRQAAAYDPEADTENTPDSVFCAHGAGFNVKWDRVREYMHLESGLAQEKAPQVITRNLRPDDRELEAIMEREFGPVKRPLYRTPQNRPATEQLTIRPPRRKHLIVDGYNVLFAWDELAQTARTDLDAARRRLMDILSSYAGFRKCSVVLVFDGYRVAGSPGSREPFHNIQVVYTKENETADAYIESLAAEIGANDAVYVVTSDALVQLSGLRSGVLRMPASELWQQVCDAEKEMRRYFQQK